MVAQDTQFTDVYVRDMLLSTTVKASMRDGSSMDGNDNSDTVSISANGQFVSFSSLADNLVQGDANNEADIFRRDIVNGATVMVSLTHLGTLANASSIDQVMSADGMFLSFYCGCCCWYLCYVVLRLVICCCCCCRCTCNCCVVVLGLCRLFFVVVVVVIVIVLVGVVVVLLFFVLSFVVVVVVVLVIVVLLFLTFVVCFLLLLSSLSSYL